MTNNASTSLSLFTGGKVSIKGVSSAVDALRNAAQSAVAGSDLPDGGVYINFSGKNGKYSIGEESADADPDEVWVADVWSFQAGYVCWKGGSPLAKRMTSIYGKPVPMPDMDEHGPFNKQGDGWYTAKSVMLRSLDSGKFGYFSTNAKSGVREFAKLEAEVAKRIEAGAPCWPVLQLRSEAFTAQTYKNFKPVLHVYGWLGMNQINKLGTMTDFSKIAEAVDDLVTEAADEAASGVVDVTFLSANGGPGANAESSYDADDSAGAGDGVEDAEVLSDAAPVEPVRRRNAAAAATASPAAPDAAQKRQRRAI